MTKVIDEYFKKVCTRDDIVSPMYYLSVLCITQSVWNTGYDCMLGYVYCEYLEFVLFIVLFVLFCTECSPCIVYLLLCTVYCPVYLYSVLCALSSVLSALYYVLCTAPCNMNYVLITVSMQQAFKHMYAMMPRHTAIKLEHYFLQHAVQLLLQLSWLMCMYTVHVL